MKVILNKCYGGFGCSDACYRLYAQKKGIEVYPYKLYAVREKNEGCVYRKVAAEDCLGGSEIYFKKDFGDSFNDKEVYAWDEHVYLDTSHREDPVLVECIEELGEKANGRYAKLQVVEIPDGMDYVIDEYDGVETLHENVRCW